MSSDRSISEAAQNQVRRFCRQYLQLEQQLTYPDAQYLKEDSVQEIIYQSLWGPEARHNCGSPRYQLKTLKKLVGNVEAGIEDWDKYGVHDGLMERMSELLSQPLPSELAAAQQKTYVVYTISALDESGGRDITKASDDCPKITLLESRTIISAQGTTGLATWEAALHMGQYLCSRPDYIKGKHVLELGAGTGYLSILCAQYLGAADVLATDGSDDVINNLPESFFLNGLQGSTKATVAGLKWGHALIGTEESKWRGGRPVDIVLGADITYDGSVIPLLIATFTDLVDLFPHVVILVAATERNRTTFEKFMTSASRSGFTVEEITFPLTPRENEDKYIV
ncbi:hypothetical protein CMQ_5947 [Grosmannia clavigera kw1407]|uniref:Nicotinamide n-methyltransferase n=1 Tax=Grosmannia clavigera (strain kw1407 / UAMH 11150) TaxID=655863 RepID=F0XMS9_GROCL|nr:uncharacterized protein CMQ_5947 [Grosmannia clavigera kw1407]EFX01005.1 hypothetical protein CMQ_5947 [Grosmannia clavigera kw1407]